MTDDLRAALAAIDAGAVAALRAMAEAATKTEYTYSMSLSKVGVNGNLGDVRKFFAVFSPDTVLPLLRLASLAPQIAAALDENERLRKRDDEGDAALIKATGRLMAAQQATLAFENEMLAKVKAAEQRAEAEAGRAERLREAHRGETGVHL